MTKLYNFSMLIYIFFVAPEAQNKWWICVASSWSKWEGFVVYLAKSRAVWWL